MARKPKAREVQVYLGTRKGGFLLRSDEKRKNWRVEGPFFPGVETNHLMRNTRTGKLWAAVNSWWFGNEVQFSNDKGKRWTKAAAGISFPPERKLSVARIWRVEADRASRPETLWCGVDPGALFRTDDGGKNWYEMTGLTQHATREKWTPGAAGMMVHVIAPDPSRVERIYVGISAAGCFRSDDDGKTWKACNQGVRADFLPNKFPEVGQCLHRMVISPKNPDWLFQQNHCGVYRSRNDADKWTDISKGLPSRFGFAMAAHPHEAETIYVTPHISAEQRYVTGGKLRCLSLAERRDFVAGAEERAAGQELLCCGAAAWHGHRCLRRSGSLRWHRRRHVVCLAQCGRLVGGCRGQPAAHPVGGSGRGLTRVPCAH